MSAASLRRRQHSKGYVLVHVPGHPLAPPSKPGWVYEHRAVFYAERGEGPFNCHWCGVVVTWPTLNVDHLDNTKNNNSPGNLVASCRACNLGRAEAKRAAACLASRGRWIEHNGERRLISDWARRIRMTPTGLAHRIDRGWPIDRALTVRTRAGQTPC